MLSLSSQTAPPFRIPTWFPDISPNQIKLMKAHFELVLSENRSLNLVSSKSLPFMDVLHFADSIMASRIMFQAGHINHLYDFGSGGGFPGLICAVLYPKTKVTLVESDKSRAAFLTKVVQQMGLLNVDVINSKIESLPENSIEFAVSRDFGSLTNNLITSRKLFSKGGQYFHLKGESWGLELSQIPVQVCSYWSPSLLGEYKLPLGEFKLSVVKTEKTQD